MELTLKQQKENPLLKRKELAGELSFQGATPSNPQLKEELAKKLNTAPDTIVIKHIYGSFGKNTANFTAYAYETKEQLEKVEPKKKEKTEAAGAPAKK